jgi:hypothetical protein
MKAIDSRSKCLFHKKMNEESEFPHYEPTKNFLK